MRAERQVRADLYRNWYPSVVAGDPPGSAVPVLGRKRGSDPATAAAVRVELTGDDACWKSVIRNSEGRKHTARLLDVICTQQKLQVSLR